MVDLLEPKCADAVIHMKPLSSLPVHIIAGVSPANMTCKALPPYAPEVLAFLASWSRHLLARRDIRNYPDALSFAYWCRPANLNRLKRELSCEPLRLGRGLVLHIAPTNVPVNFAYSLAFGLLAGNANIVRLSESLPIQAHILCSVANDLLSGEEHKQIASMITLLSYPRDDAITEALSAISDVRVLWGGDKTISNLRRMPAPPRCVDITFADRYSLCLMSASLVLSAESKMLSALTIGFYNDVFILDQNACSSPHLILWQGTDQEVEAAKKRFWDAMQDLLNSKGWSPGMHAVQNYTHLCRTTIQIQGVKVSHTPDNSIFRIALDELPENISEYRGSHGFFFETIDNNLNQLKRIVNARYQTLTCFCEEPNKLAEMVVSNGLAGIDRVVPVGKALDISVIWDGYDLIRTMSRIVATQ